MTSAASHSLPRVPLPENPDHFKHQLTMFCAPDLLLSDASFAAPAPAAKAFRVTLACICAFAESFGITSRRALLLNPARGTSLVRSATLRSAALRA